MSFLVDEEEVDTYVSYGKCISPDCSHTTIARGLCMQCYDVSRRLIANGQTTWDELEESGFARAPRYPRKTKSDPSPKNGNLKRQIQGAIPP